MDLDRHREPALDPFDLAQLRDRHWGRSPDLVREPDEFPPIRSRVPDQQIDILRRHRRPVQHARAIADDDGVEFRRAKRLCERDQRLLREDRKSTRLNSSHEWISYAVFCLKKKRNHAKSSYQ